MRIAVPVVLLAALAAGQPVPESFILDTTPVWWPGDSIEEMPAAAVCGDNFLVAWQTRTGTDWDLLAVRVAHSGEVLDSHAFVVSDCSLDQRSPQVAGGAGACLVVWEDRRSGTRWDIFGARVDAGGNLLDPQALPIRAGSGDSRSPAAAYGHGRWLVAWEEQSGDGDVYAAILDSSGAVGPAVPVCRAGRAQAQPAVAATDSGFVVAWEDWRNGQYPQVRCARLGPDGAVLDTAGIELWPDRYDQERPAVVRLGENALIAWEESALLDSEIWGVRLSPAGAVLDSAPVRVAAAPGPQRRPRLTALGDDALAVWVDSRNSATVPDLYAARVRADGSVANPDGVPVTVAAGTQDQPCVAGADTLALVAWRDIPDGTVCGDIRAARVSTRDSVLDPEGFGLLDLWIPLYYAQLQPAIADGGGQYLVAWTDYRGQTTGLDIYGMRISHAGAALDPVPFVICSVPGDQQSPQVAFNGTQFLVIWSDLRSLSQALHGTRVDTLGRVVDTVNLVLSSGGSLEASVCVAGDSWFVVWRAGSGSNIRGTFVLTDGSVTHPGGFDVTPPSTTWNYYPIARFDGTRLLVLWTESRLHYGSEVAGRRLSHDGTALDSVRYYSNLPGHDRKPALTFDGDNYFVTWVYRQGADYAICCLRVDTAGVALDSPPAFVRQSPNYYDNADVVFNGAHHYLVWAELAGSSWLVQGARVGRSTTVFDTFPLVADERQVPVPALAASPGGEMLMVYAGLVDSINSHPAGVPRIKGVLSPYGGVAEAKPASTSPVTLRAAPVPFRREVRFEAAPGGAVTIRDCAGRLVRTLAVGASGAVAWNGADELGGQTARGVYFAEPEPSPGRAARCKLVKLE
ncbi:MAG: hypothetical protein R6X12_01485 [bacterium]